MATINDEGRSYLEIQGQEARQQQTAQSDYNQLNYYDEKHDDALATGDAQGKGTGDFGGHGYTVPDMTKPKEQMSYANFNTSDGGNDCDQSARAIMMARSIYGPNKQYGIDVVPDTSLNVADGQYDGTIHSRKSYICPVS